MKLVLEIFILVSIQIVLRSHVKLFWNTALVITYKLHNYVYLPDLVRLDMRTQLP